MKPTFRQSINNTVENRNLWIVLWVKERCSQFHSIEVTWNKMSLFCFIQRNHQIKHGRVWEDFFNHDFFFSQLEFLLFYATRNRILKNHPLSHELWKSRFDLDFTLSVACWCLEALLTLLDVQGKWEGVERIVLWGLKAKPALLKLYNSLGCY